MMRRVWAGICTAAMVVGVMVGGSAPATAAPVAAATGPAAVETVLGFSDITDKTTFAREILWLANEDISRGWVVGQNREYRPLVTITREQMAAFLYRMAGEPDVDLPATSPFRDVTARSTFYKEIVWLAEEGISRGWTTSRGAEFRPLLPITREQMAAFLYRMAGEPTFTAPATPRFLDVGTRSTFYREIEWLASTEVTTGWSVPGGGAEYRPLAGTKRDVMAAFLYRYSAMVTPEVPIVDGVVAAPETQVLEEQDLNGATYDGDAGALVLPASSSLKPAPNDVLTVGVTPTTPEGMLARVVSIATQPDGTQVLTMEPATLADALLTTDGLIRPTPTLVSSDVEPLSEGTVVGGGSTARAAKAPTAASDRGEALATQRFGWSTEFTVAKGDETASKTLEDIIVASQFPPGTDLAKLTPEYGKVDASGSVTGEFEFGIVTDAEMGIDFEVDVGLSGLNELEFAVWDTRRTTVWGEMAAVANAELKVDIARWTPVWTLQAGPAPIVVTTEFTVTLALSAEGKATLEFRNIDEVDTRVGVSYDSDRGFQGIDEHGEPVEIPFDIAVGGEMGLKAEAKLQGDLRLYGVVGFLLAGGPYASLAFAGELGDNEQWSCKAEWGLEGEWKVVVGLKALGTAVGPQFEFPVWDGSLPLWDDDPCADTVPSTLPPAALDQSLDRAVAGEHYAEALGAVGGVEPYEWSLTGLPDGLAAHPDGRISGIPTEAGTFEVEGTVTDLHGSSGTRTYVLTVDPPPPLTVTETGLPAGIKGSMYGVTLHATGGIGPYQWRISGDVPGIDMGAGPTISGTPTSNGVFPVTVVVEDSQGERVEQVMHLDVTWSHPRLGDIALASASGGAAGAEPTRAGALSGDGSAVALVDDFSLLSHDLASGAVSELAGDIATDAWLGDGLAASVDGSRVAFVATGHGTIATDANPGADVFLHDSVSGATTLASPLSAWGASWTVISADISDSGRYVTFDATVSGVADRAVFLFDAITGTVQEVSAALPVGVSATGPTISADGSRVAYYASNTRAGTTVTYAQSKVMVTTVGGATSIVSTDTGGAALAGEAKYPVISADGNHVVFTQLEETGARLYVKTLGSGALEAVATQGPLGVPIAPLWASGISADGSRVLFVESAPDASASPAYRYHAWLHETGGIQAHLVSTDATGTPVGVSASPALSNDGREALLASNEALTSADANSVTDLYRRGLPY